MDARPTSSHPPVPSVVTRLAPVGLVLAGLCAYANSWHTPFLFDDAVWIVENPYVHSLSLRGIMASPPLSTSAPAATWAALPWA